MTAPTGSPPPSGPRTPRAPSPSWIRSTRAPCTPTAATTWIRSCPGSASRTVARDARSHTWASSTSPAPRASTCARAPPEAGAAPLRHGQIFRCHPAEDLEGAAAVGREHEHLALRHVDAGDGADGELGGEEVG